tara:strand:- start:3620 stop:4156 length:537 start_codon:yes stop_codon:yes gene_type:complete
LESKKRIAIVGPESSGKSDLSQCLGQEFDEPWVKEMSRVYLEAQHGQYEESDLVKIAQLQLEEEEMLFNEARRFLFCDTNLLVIIIWSEWKYNRVLPDLEKLWNAESYDLHLLCKPDLPYEDDPLRENPNPEDRIALFEMYHKALIDLGVPFELIEGRGDERLKKAKSALSSHFPSYI